MSVLAQMQALANLDAEQGQDFNVAQKGGGGGRLLPAGYAFGRLVEYVEYGMQPQEFAGKAKDPAMEFTLGFALTGQGYQNDDGTPYIIRTFTTALTMYEKSRAFLMFKLLNWRGTAKTYAQLLNETYLVKIVQVPKSKTDPTLVSRMDLTGFLPPLDPVTKAPYPIAQVPEELFRLFLWSHPTKEAWDSLFIEGVNDDKTSRNRIQETILGALDFQGSALQEMLMNSGVTALPTAPLAAAVAPVQVAVSAPVVAATVANETVSAAVVAPVAPAIPSVPVVPVGLPVGLPAVPVLPV